jgi:hypothetical protein
VRRIKSTVYIPLIPTFSLKGEGADIYAQRERESLKIQKCLRLLGNHSTQTLTAGNGQPISLS